MRIRRTGLDVRPTLFFLGVSLLAGAASSQVTTKRIATGFSNPLWIGAPDGDPRVFFAIQSGGVRIIKNGVHLSNPFLSIPALTSGGSEQGLLGMAFHPDYANNGFFFLNYTNNSGNTVVSRWSVDPGDPDRADPSSEEIVITINQPFSNHNGGDIHFNPLDGYLYIGTGDGGSANDPACRAQNLNNLLGKMLRIDVDTLPYSIPADNPFVGVPSTRGEVYHYGLRNPWRFSFDRVTGDLYIGDVGQNAREEISFAAHADAGVNFGWKIMEGNRCNSTSSCPGGTPACFNAAYTPPIVELFQSGFGGPLSIIGGYVYRGDLMPGEVGTYFFADFNDDIIRSIEYDVGSNTVSNFQDRTSELTPNVGAIRNIAAWGEDGFGELYIADHTASQNGEIFKVVPVGAAQASAVIDNGSGINAVTYTAQSLPIIGNVYKAEVDVSTHPGGATFSLIFGFSGVSSFPTAIGEILISGTNVFSFAVASSGGVDSYSENIPVALGFNGVQVQSQAFSIGAGTTVAYNAVHLTAGMY
jgi:glucose/arabinose dehydrogenase